MKISVLSIITNEDQARESKSYIDQQSLADQIELIQIDNKQNQFPSAAAAYNFHAKRASGDILIFMHQDVYLWDADAVMKICAFLDEHPQSIVGVAGVSAEDHCIYGDLFETKAKLRRTLPCPDAYMLAVTVDECLFAMTADRFRRLGFDEITTDNWHLYGADICYQNLHMGGKNYILPLAICHDSTGNQDTRLFHQGVSKMIQKYKGTLDYLRTTCITVPCSHAAHFKWKIYRRLYLIFKKQ